MDGINHVCLVKLLQVFQFHGAFKSPPRSPVIESVVDDVTNEQADALLEGLIRGEIFHRVHVAVQEGLSLSVLVQELSNSS